MTHERTTWDGLTLAHQYRVAREVALRRGLEFGRRFKGVISVGAGYQGVGEPSAGKRQVALLFTVRDDSSHAEHSIPAHIRARVPQGDNWSMVAIPTDVESMGRGSEEGGQSLEIGIRARPYGSSTSERGAVCALLQGDDAARTQYLLSCHHVLTGIMRDPRSTGTKQRVYRRSDGKRVGRTRHWNQLFPTKGFGLDAALAEVRDKRLVSPKVQGVRPLKVARRDSFPQNASLYTPRRVALPFDFIGERFSLELEYSDGRRARHAIVYLGKAKTRRGDSGSPLVGTYPSSPTIPVLFGMHIYGLHLNGEKVSVVIPAYQLITDAPFGLKTRLV